jgi:methylenetetrahydrofolate--tRNA-(uracil-5-)-methyltransferase
VPFGWFNPSAGRFALTSPKYDSYNALLLDLSLAERSTQMREDIVIIGGGLAGSEAAWQAANRGAKVTLYEMRPKESTPAHKTGGLAELVCSNSLGSADPQNAAGILKEEMRRHQSLIIKVADQVRVPAGSALAVDRDQFSFLITQALDSHPNVRILREEMTEIPTDCVCIVATGPLTSDKLSQAIARLTHSNHLYFYDAISPIVDADSINMDIAFRASRYGKGGDDYLNCPMDEATYQAFYDALLAAEKVQPKAFEQTPFEACLPIEVMAERGRQTMQFGPLKPVGLEDPKAGRRPYAVVQLRTENAHRSCYNMVGFQTRLTYGEQKRVFRMIPGLGQAEFLRYGSLHRNTFINSPQLLHNTLQFKERPTLFFAGQLVGVEGYIDSAAMGGFAGINAVRELDGLPPLTPPPTTAHGCLLSYITTSDPRHFQPMNMNFGLFPPLTVPVKDKERKRQLISQRALEDHAAWMSRSGLS